jgi:hypothetical protein
MLPENQGLYPANQGLLPENQGLYPEKLTKSCLMLPEIESPINFQATSSMIARNQAVFQAAQGFILKS